MVNYSFKKNNQLIYFGNVFVYVNYCYLIKMVTETHAEWLIVEKMHSNERQNNKPIRHQH